ncbi:efflux RND transporter permease subunit [Candidatus Protochlamydia phocaeensis]|uniref:efflux RND transporter permease subunit n=1 Tax=Candidatus Protochlamydia phocaeensis TaxID=1414722 RepID=UPI0008388EA3|nr:efflux RND transporter permease subunit [Candidatus Protochlamydia phocaeensis]
MNLSAPFIKRPIMTILIMAALFLAGVMAFNHLPVSNLPDVDYPTIDVSVSFPGASPEAMANTVASPLEKEFMTIPGIEDVASTNTLGSSSIILRFSLSKSMDSAAQDVEAAISRAKIKLPPDLPNDPSYKKVNPSDTPIIYIALTSDTMPLADLYTYANIYIGQRLSMLDGVAQVTTYGSPYAIRIQVNPHTLANLGITLEDISRTIIKGNPYFPTGELNGHVRSSTIIAKGQLEKAGHYAPLIVAYRNQAPVRIQDLGHAIDSLQNDKFAMRYVDAEKNQPTVVLAVQRQPGANTVKVAEEIHQTLPILAADLPASVQLKIVFDKSESIKQSVEEVELTLIVALALVVLVIFFYLGKVVDTLIPALVLPLSILGTFIFMHLLGYSIDNLSLLALILAVGFIIDDAIVVLENIVRRVEKGEDPWHASLEGAKQIGFTILSMTLSLIAVFIPMIFMGGLIGKIFQEFAITLVIVTFFSGLLSLTLTPMLCSRLIQRRQDAQLNWIEKLSFKLNHALIALYKRCLQGMFRYRWFALLLGVLSIAASGYYFYQLPKDFIPDDDMGFIIAYTQSEEGTSPSRMIGYQEKVLETIKSDPGVDNLVSIAAYPQYRNGIMFIRLKPKGERPPINQIIQRLYGKLLFIPGINTYLKNVPLIDLSVGTESKASYQYTLQGLHEQALYQATEKLLEKMQTMPIFQSVSSNLEIKSPQLHVHVLRDQASSLGVSAESIETALQLAYTGGRVSRIQTPLDQYDVILELEPHFQKQAGALSDIYVRSYNTGQLVPLNAVAKWEEIIGPASINHINQFPATTISFNLAPGIPLGEALERLRQTAKEILPSSVTGQVKGTAETFEESIQNTSVLLLIAVLAIYIVLGILYESFIHPLTILSTLPPATLGGLLTLAYFGLPLSLYAYLGMILLIGIVKKNGIMMVDYALENERILRLSPQEAMMEACLARSRPIMMTTITAIMGAVPLALAIGSGAEARRPLGLVIIGGLLFSQLITLFVTPVIYLYLARFNAKMGLTAPVSVQAGSHP